MYDDFRGLAYNPKPPKLTKSLAENIIYEEVGRRGGSITDFEQVKDNPRKGKHACMFGGIVEFNFIELIRGLDFVYYFNCNVCGKVLYHYSREDGFLQTN